MSLSGIFTLIISLLFTLWVFYHIGRGMDKAQISTHNRGNRKYKYEIEIQVKGDNEPIRFELYSDFSHNNFREVVERCNTMKQNKKFLEFETAEKGYLIRQDAIEQIRFKKQQIRQEEKEKRRWNAGIRNRKRGEKPDEKK